PNGGGLGMVAIGVGGTDAVDVMADEPFVLSWPGIIGVHLTGKLNGWTSSKDVILKLMGILTVNGGTGSIVEFFGEGCKNISATGKATITNMGAEHGATTSVFAYDSTMSEYLRASKRAEWADLAEQYVDCLHADPEVYAEPENFYDQVIRIDLTELEPHIVGPHSPDLARPISKMKEAVRKEKYPDAPTSALVGSCTNSSYEDIGRSSSVATEALKYGLKAKMPFYITPGSETVFQTVKRDGYLDSLEAIGGTVLANACGPCIGQWHRRDITKGQRNSIISSYNRNFPGRNDGSRETLSFLTSPEITTAMALGGSLSFNPLTDTLKDKDGKKVKLSEPMAEALPEEGLKIDKTGLLEPLEDSSKISVVIKKGSTRLALLEPFVKFSPKDFLNMPILLKAKGKCTTDHISQAGPWLRFRGHLDKISDNTYKFAVNAFTDDAGVGVDSLKPKSAAKPFPEIARDYKNSGVCWVVIGDENFGEGSSREHAAMQPRYLGCKVIITRSFARIHETNLKKHGILPLVFENPKNYDEIKADDKITIANLDKLETGKPVEVELTHKNGEKEQILCKHTMSKVQIEWFYAGSALNYLAGE
ncbi:aconitate hydratase, partial [Sulfobacillus acidophilus]|nr:aconitate hydratase [Sulfobacillus acidophilus]